MSRQHKVCGGFEQVENFQQIPNFVNSLEGTLSSSAIVFKRVRRIKKVGKERNLGGILVPFEGTRRIVKDV